MKHPFRPLYTTLACLCLAAAILALGCAEPALNKQVAAHQSLMEAEHAAAVKAQANGDSVAYAAHLKAAEDERARIADLESKRAAARAADDSWSNFGIQSATGLTNILLPGAGLLVGGLATLITQKIRGRTFSDGQVAGATIATTAITNADTNDTLQPSAARTAIAANLDTAPPAVAAAVHAAL